jgi:DNA-binding beta-propeller fold protein YncE
MNRALITGWMALLAMGCGQDTSSPLDDVLLVTVNSLSADLSIVRAGEPAQILRLGGEILVLSSTSNSLEVIDPATWKVARQYSVGDGCNPMWMAAAADGKLVVSCWLSNELLLVDPKVALDQNPVLKHLAMPTGADLLPASADKPGIARPQGIAVVGNKAYVTLNNTDTGWKPAGPGLLLVVDIAAWIKVKIIPLSGKNAVAALRSVKIPNTLWATCAGAFDGSGTVDVIDLTTDSVSDAINIGGAPGVLYEASSGIVWVANMLDGNVLGFLPETNQPRDPLLICPSDMEAGVFNFVADIGSDGKGNLYVACFATDQVMFLDEDSDGAGAVALDVGDGPTSLLVVPR